MVEPLKVTLDAVFPLYFRIDQQGIVEELSSGLEREIGSESLGRPFLEAFRITRPLIKGPHRPFQSYGSKLFLFRTWDDRYAMRGQVRPLPRDDGGVLLLVTPWLTWLLEHQPSRVLSPESFSALDAQMELQIYLSSQQMMMSDLQNLLGKLKQANLLATAASAAKSEFINHVSHELRTPLNGIVGALELLESSALDMDSMKWVGVIQKSSEALLTVINQILDYSRTASADESLRRVEFNAAGLCQHVLDILAVEALRMNARVVLVSCTASTGALCGDAVKIQDVLLRLVANAIKHASPGEVQVVVSVRGDEETDTWELYLEVRDQGPGIKMRDRERIFEEFSAVRLPLNSANPAPGLGLAIARAQARQMGGEVGLIEPEQGPGSIFWFSVPVTPAPQAQASIQQVPDDAPLPPRAILVVDDNPLNLQLARVQLESLGMVVESAESGREALEKCRRREFGLIFMDIQMPEQSGLEATRALRALPTCAQIPIIAWTANAADSDAALYRDVGMSDTLDKPTSKAAFAAMLRTWLK